MGWSVKMEMKLRFSRSRSPDVDIQYLVWFNDDLFVLVRGTADEPCVLPKVSPHAMLPKP